MIAEMREAFATYLKNGSGWMLKRVVRLDITLSRLRPLRGSSRIKLPKAIAKRKALINMKNEDEECFKWAVTRALNPVDENPQRVTNELSRKKVVHLFFLKNEDGTASHHCVVKKMSALVGAQVSKKKEKKYVCDFCLNVFGSQALLEYHEEYCSKHDAVNTIMPKPVKDMDNSKFKNIQNSVECPIKIYADFESFLQPIDKKHAGRQSYISGTFPRPSASTSSPASKVSIWIPSRT